MAADVVMYRTPFCPYCHRAAALLQRKGVAFREVDVSHDDRARDRLIEASGRRTVPQIFINGVSVGGFDDIAALDRRGELDPLLNQPASAPHSL